MALSVNEVFTKHFDHAVANFTRVDFDPTWHNGTGYFDRLVQSPVGMVTEINWTIDNNKRRILVVNTGLGNVVIFDRYADQNTISVQMPKEVADVTGLSTAGQITTERELDLLLGAVPGGHNIGDKIYRLVHTAIKNARAA